MARPNERDRVRTQLGEFAAGTPRAIDSDPPPPDTALTGDHDAVRTPRWLDDLPGGSTWRERLLPPRFHGARLDSGRRGVLTMAAIGLFACAVTVIAILWHRPETEPVPPLPAAFPAALPTETAAAGIAPPTGDVPAPPQAAELVVSVVGLVHHSGLVRLAPGSRVADAIEAAGGVHNGADLTGLNLAQRLADGDQVRVGAADAAAPPVGSTTVSGDTAAEGEKAGATAAGAPLNLNTATGTELEELPGVGPVTAAAIVAWRETNGRFTDVEQLTEVDGIGPATLARLRDMVTV